MDPRDNRAPIGSEVQSWLSARRIANQNECNWASCGCIACSWSCHCRPLYAFQCSVYSSSQTCIDCNRWEWVASPWSHPSLCWFCEAAAHNKRPPPPICLLLVGRPARSSGLSGSPSVVADDPSGANNRAEWPTAPNQPWAPPESRPRAGACWPPLFPSNDKCQWLCSISDSSLMLAILSSCRSRRMLMARKRLCESACSKTWD